jgi:uncharacterized protein
MEIEVLKRILANQKEEIEEKLEKEKIIERDGLKLAKKYLSSPNILVILGIRRSGKSVFSMLLSKELKQKVGYINFVDERLINLGTEDLDKALQAMYELNGDVDFIILDEAQQVKGWELFANRLRRTKKIIITGSDSKLLSGELATHITGRHINFVLYPFSFKELNKNIPITTKEIAQIKNKLKKYVEGSGFPEYQTFGKQMIREIYADITTKDCIQRHKIRDQKSFRELALYLTTNFASEFTYSKLAKITSLKDTNTAKRYVQFLQEAYMIKIIDRYSPKLKQQIIAPKKTYCIDQGFCNFISFNFTRNYGKKYENIVCIELLRKQSKKPEIEIYYWKNHQQNEVDFVIKEKNKIIELIQVCYNIEDEKTKEREIKSLIKASKELNCNKLTIITADKDTTEKINKKEVQYKPLWKWLLKE